MTLPPVGDPGLAPTPPVTTLNELADLVEAQPGWRRIGQILIDLGYLTADRLDAALAEQYRRGPGAPTGLLDLLVARGAITDEQARAALTQQILTQYLPALGASLHRERRLAGAAEAARQELADSYGTALRTIATLNEEVERLSGQVGLQRQRIGELEAELAPHRRTDQRAPAGGRRLPARVALSIGIPAVILLVVLAAWIVLPILADRYARPFVPLAEPVPTTTPGR